MIDYQIACIDLDASGTYDAANRVETITAGGITTTYTYNDDGDRISQTVGTVTTTYVLDTATPSEIWWSQIPPTMVLSETNHSTNVTTLYLKCPQLSRPKKEQNKVDQSTTTGAAK
jgi:YD repeat-containing protein